MASGQWGDYFLAQDIEMARTALRVRVVLYLPIDPRTATGVARALRARSVPRLSAECPPDMSPGPFEPRAPECWQKGGHAKVRDGPATTTKVTKRFPCNSHVQVSKKFPSSFPCLFGKWQGKPTQKTRISYACRTPKIFGKEGKNAQNRSHESAHEASHEGVHGSAQESVQSSVEVHLSFWGAQGDGTEVTQRAQYADFRRKPQIFADSPFLLEIPAFGGRRKP